MTRQALEENSDRRLRLRVSGDGIRALLNRKPVTLLDLSLTGLGFETTQRLNPHGCYELQLETELGTLRVSGQIVWCRVAEMVATEERLVAPLFRAGLRFGPLSSEDARLLHRLLETRGQEVREESQEEHTSSFRRADVEKALREHAATERRAAEGKDPGDGRSSHPGSARTGPARHGATAASESTTRITREEIARALAEAMANDERSDADPV